MERKNILILVATLVAFLFTSCSSNYPRSTNRDQIPEDTAQQPRFVEPDTIPRPEEPTPEEEPAPEPIPVVDICPNIAGKWKHFKGWGEEITTKMIENGFGGHTCEVTMIGFGKKPMITGPLITWHDNPEEAAVVFPLDKPAGWYYEVIKTSEGIEITIFDNDGPDYTLELKP